MDQTKLTSRDYKTMDSSHYKSIYLQPRLSEKTYGLSNSRVYVVEVPKSINKVTIKKAIESQFKVIVTKINIANITGKNKRNISKKGRRVSQGKDNDIKKAYVTLAEGSSLPFFNAIEEEEKKTEKIQQEIEKKQEKENKPKRRIGRLKKTEKEES